MEKGSRCAKSEAVSGGGFELKTYVINKRGKINGVIRYGLSLCENGKVKHELTYFDEVGKQAADRDGKEWIAGNFDPSTWFNPMS